MGLAEATYCIEDGLNKVLLYSTGNYIQYLAINHNGREHKKKEYICVTKSLCYAEEINMTLKINYTLIIKKKSYYYFESA